MVLHLTRFLEERHLLMRTLLLSISSFSLLAPGLSAGTAAFGAVPRLLHSNGPLITDPTGGTGANAGLPISKTEPFPYNGLLGNTTGTNAAISSNSKLADDFYVPQGGWDLDQITVYAFQTSTGNTVGTLQINLWNVTPFTPNSPVPPPDGSTPAPMLATPLSFNIAGTGTFVANRVSGTATDATRPIYKYTVSADGLPNGGALPEGHYWLEMSFLDTRTTHGAVYVPLVTPRAQAFNLNMRQSLAFGNPTPYWFEGREGYGSVENPDGRPYAIPFELVGTPEPATLLAALAAGSTFVIRQRTSK